ncbi:ABC transporter ATP-binding protein [Microbacterium phyllosphaerae]|uniref:ABC transporter ATP-binding protein n=1 Tax=Microbacterium phyllosphaerae TaxID=124798 RepID=UPI0021688F53|nr:ATP-binding cassette domain-containing protein [Microbacterium phyllosphaerae]MCS3442149.1 putative ABC transport system ATP-binding protein [Microbacterium phyllosphaerae]
MNVEGVSMFFGTRQILRSVSFELPAGRSLAIMGASGAGKSTLLSIIAGIEEPAMGRVTGVAPERIQWVLQSAPVLPRRSALDNVMLGALAQGVEVPAARINALRAMRELGVEHLARTSLFRLSGGERQRVALGRALAVDSDLILADEPTASLDYVAKERVIDALHRAVRLNRRILVATHDQDVADACDVTMHLRNGMLVPR